MGPFSLTGQPNAMGGREVGGLANQLAAHMNFSPPEIDRVRRFWDAPNIATREGLKAVQMFEAIERGEIKALWVMATNPAVSLPRAGAMRDALSKLELFVVSENVAVERHGECRRAHSASRRGVGREGRHGDEFRAAHLAPARFPAAARRGAARTGGSSRKSRGAWDLRTRSPIRVCRRHLPRACRAVGVRERRHARFRSRRAERRSSDESFDALDPVVWPCREGETRRRASSPTAASSRRTARRASSRRKRPRCAAPRRTNIRSSSTPAACATSGTP